MDTLSWFALGILIVVILCLVYGIVALHDIPANIAKKRGHPHHDAIHAAGWVSLFTLHAIWPFLWIWALAYHPKHGYKGGHAEAEPGDDNGEIDRLRKRVSELEEKLTQNQTSSPSPDEKT
jgi:hypothetical protein